MKRIAAILLVLCLLLAQALAETTIDPKEARNIPLTEAGENETPDGISPTTGRTLSKLYVPEGYAGLAATGRYLPMLVQIGNDGGQPRAVGRGVCGYPPRNAADKEP